MICGGSVRLFVAILFGDLWRFRSVICDNSIRWFVTILFGEMYSVYSVNCHHAPVCIRSSTLIFFCFGRKAFSQFVTQYRLNTACELLRHSQKSVSEICCLVGFNDLPHFVRVFAGAMEMSPSKYRKRMKVENGWFHRKKMVSCLSFPHIREIMTGKEAHPKYGVTGQRNLSWIFDAWTKFVICWLSICQMHLYSVRYWRAFSTVLNRIQYGTEWGSLYDSFKYVFNCLFFCICRKYAVISNVGWPLLRKWRFYVRKIDCSE